MMQSFAKQKIRLANMLDDRTGVVMRITELILKPYDVSDVSEVADKECCPHIGAILVDSLMAVSHPVKVHLSYSIKPYSNTFRMVQKEQTRSMNTCDIYRSFCTRQTRIPYRTNDCQTEIYPHFPPEAICFSRM